MADALVASRARQGPSHARSFSSLQSLDSSQLAGLPALQHRAGAQQGDRQLSTRQQLRTAISFGAAGDQEGATAPGGSSFGAGRARRQLQDDTSAALPCKQR